MPLPEGRAGSVCVYFISCIFFLLTFAGGSCLVLYMALPDSMDSIWYAIIGMLLVATPWTFWLVMCVYRLTKYPGPDLGQRTQARNGTVAAATTGRDDELGPDEQGETQKSGQSLSKSSSQASDESERALRFAAS